ncbi:MAG: DUF2191 domain-containing protein [Proteobacteria bacterium]|jgi:hypothetical protein|nr:DUF2191 domain-containing protein [Pseudomonadota bacterium]
MRTTLTLDDDVAARLKSEVRRSGRTFREVANESLRRGLAAPRAAGERPTFKVVPHHFGQLRAGLSLDNTFDLIEQVDGPLHR